MRHNRVVENWMGSQVETLKDLLRPKLWAVCVGINPAIDSVRAGHYYQGTLGQRFLSRLREVGFIEGNYPGAEDDAAFADGVGFTDIVKRPTRSEAELIPAEYAFGKSLLHTKLLATRPKFVIFTFKKAAEKYFGDFDGCGFVKSLQLAASDVFVMPGPYASKGDVTHHLNALRARRAMRQA